MKNLLNCSKQSSGNGFCCGTNFKIFSYTFIIEYLNPNFYFGPWYIRLQWYKAYPWNSYTIWLGKYKNDKGLEHTWTYKAGLCNSKIYK